MGLELKLDDLRNALAVATDQHGDAHPRSACSVCKLIDAAEALFAREEGERPHLLDMDFFSRPGLLYLGTNGIVSNVIDEYDTAIDALNEVDTAVLEALSQVIVARIHRRTRKVEAQ